MDLVKLIEMANKIESPEPTQVGINDGRHIKALIISLVEDGAATHSTRRLLRSIENTKSKINPLILNATTPDTISRDLRDVTHLKKKPEWTWPQNDLGNGLDLRTGLYRKAYRANDQRKVVACMVSHMRAWQHCIDINEPIMVLEQDALFIRPFSWEEISEPKPIKNISDGWWERWKDTREMTVLPWNEKKKWETMRDAINKEPVGNFKEGILGLNSPIGATRKASVFHDKLFGQYGFHKVPSVDGLGDDPLPQGLAGNSAYIIKPWAAKKLLDKVDEIGMWPNDALMCKQFFPWMQVCWPYYTVVQGTTSSTTG